MLPGGVSVRECLSKGIASRVHRQYLTFRKHGAVAGQSKKVSARVRAAVIDTPHKREADIVEDEDDEFEDFDSPDMADGFTTQQVQELMNVVCNETEFAEIQLKVGGLAIKAKRLATGASAIQNGSAPLALESSVATSPPRPANEQPFQSTASIDESQILSPMPSPTSSGSSMDEDDYDENLLYIGAPKVGVLRRGRYARGKRLGKAPIAEEGSRIKKGQPLAFIEQLGTFVPVEAPQAGEIISFNIEDGTAVEYKEVIVEIAPFFGGHIIGDRKYA